MRSRIGTLFADRRGGVAVLAAGGMSALIGATALAVDVGSLYLAKRELQGAADAAALAAVARRNDARGGAMAAISANNPAARLADLAEGSYSRDPDVAWDSRFTAGPAGDAVQVTLEMDSPLYFSRIFTGATTSTISAKATAARSDMAGFWIGSRLAALNAGLPNALLSGLTGSNVGLTVMDYQALAAARVDLLTFTEALRTELDMEAATFAETLDAQAMLPQVLRAIAASVDGLVPRAALVALAGVAHNTSVDMTRLIDLGPKGTLQSEAEGQEMTVDALRLLTAVAQTAGGARQVTIDVGAAVPGLTSTRVDLAIGERPQESPWLAVAADGSVIVRTAQTRLRVETLVTGGAAPLASVRVPLFVELASAEAHIQSISCASETGSRVQLAVTPSIGRLALAESDASALSNFGQAMPLQQATLVNLPLLSVRGFGDIQLGGASAQTVGFTSTDVTNHVMKTVRTNDAATATTASLVQQTQLSVNGLGLSLGAPAVTTVLGAAAPVLDDLLGNVFDILGVGLGEADVGVSKIRCGVPMLVG